MPARATRAGVVSASDQVSGKVVSHLTLPDAHRLEIHLADGMRLVVEQGPGGLAVTAAAPGFAVESADDPTARQREYLEFIAQYMRRYGRSPAESDIQRRFLISAPAANQMVRTLERRGFITRQPDVPRSIRTVEQPGRRTAT